jgi:hypothetical protein
VSRGADQLLARSDRLRRSGDSSKPWCARMSTHSRRPKLCPSATHPEQRHKIPVAALVWVAPQGDAREE